MVERSRKSMRQPRKLDLLSDFFAPVFECLLDDDHELVGDGAVDNAVVITESEMDDGSDSDGVGAIFVGNDQRLFGNSAYTHDGDVGLVDDRQAEHRAELSRIGDRESRAFDIGGHELLGSGAFTEVCDAALQAEEVELVGILEDGNDESIVESNSDTGIHVAVIADVIAVDGCIRDRILLEGNDGGSHEEWHEG